MRFIVDIETFIRKEDDKIVCNAMKDRILCISLLNIENDTPVTFYGEDEKQILTQFWNAIKDAKEIITFNGDAFDIPFVIKRSLILNIKIKTGYGRTDLRKVVNSFFVSYDKYSHGKLTDWAVILGMEPKKENGEKMTEYYEKKDWKAIKEHSEYDCVITKKLYQRCKEVGLLK